MLVVKKIKNVLVIMAVICLASCSVDNNQEVIEKINEEEKQYIEDSNKMFYYDDTEPKEFREDKIFNNVLDYPNVDGSTALIPLMVKAMEKTCGIPAEMCEERIVCNKTDGAWKSLARGTADLLFVGSMPQKVKEDIENDRNTGFDTWDVNYEIFKYKEYLCCPIRREGLVFIVNKDNPIESLTQQQLIDIYTGKIENWKELGGDDIAIKAFQRDETSGSQTYFRKLLLKGIEPIKAEKEMYIGTMGGLIDTLASYDNAKNAIGYSVYYYANNMYANDDLKIISVDGIMPSNNTITSGEYPLITESLMAIKKDESSNSNVHLLYDYMRSNRGKELIREAGYVPVD